TSTEITCQPALVLKLEVHTALDGDAQIGDPAHNKMTIVSIGLFHSFYQVFFYHIEWHGRQKVTVGQHVQAIPVATDPSPAFGVAVPGCNILLADGPVHSVSVFQVCFKIEIDEPVTLAAPHQ